MTSRSGSGGRGEWQPIHGGRDKRLLTRAFIPRSAIQVLTKMLDSNFLRRLKSSGLVENTYLCFRRAEAGDDDRILDWALAYLIATVVRDQRIAEPLLKVTLAQVNQGSEGNLDEDHTSDVLEMISGMLGRSWAGQVIEPTIKGLTKAEKLSVTTLKEIITKSSLVEPGSFKVIPVNSSDDRTIR